MCKSLLVFHRNYVSRTVSDIFSVKNGVTLKPGLGDQKRSKVKEIIVLIKARSFLDELNLEHLTS